MIQDLAIDSVATISIDLGNGLREVDIKKYIKVEKIPGGQLEESKVLKGVMFNKDVVSPGKMRRRIENPRIILLDSPLEYKKGENMTNAELMREEDWYCFFIALMPILNWFFCNEMLMALCLLFVGNWHHIYSNGFGQACFNVSFDATYVQLEVSIIVSTMWADNILLSLYGAQTEVELTRPCDQLVMRENSI